MTEDAKETVREIARHLEFLQTKYRLYRGAVFRAILQRQENEVGHTWVNILASFRLRNVSSEEGVTRFHPLTEDLQLVEVSANPLALPSFLTRVLKKKRYAVGQDHNRFEVHIRTQPESEPRFEQPEFLHREDFKWRHDEDCGGVVHFLSTNSPLGQVALSRQSLERLGFMQLKQLLWHHIFNPGGETPESPPMKDTTGIYAIVPNYHAHLKEAVLEGRTVRVRVATSRGVHLQDFRLVLQAYRSTKDAIGWSMLLPPKIWESLHRREVEYTYKTAPHHVRARLYWNLGRNDAEKFVDEHRVERAELVLYPQLAVHRHFDPELRAVVKALETRSQSPDLEWAVGTLLALSGFQVDWMGFKGKIMQGDIDIVAYWPSGKLAVLGECTVRGADLDRKITDLAERSEEVAESLESWEVRKVLFTTLSWAAIQPSQKQGAKELQIALVTKESLRSLLHAIKSAIPPDMLWERLRPDSHSPLSLESP
jgi:hypothetical protein